jgi:hypothetical protein
VAWSAPMTAIAGAVFTAAQFNQFVRDNLLETAPAKATTDGSHFAVSGVNQIAERRCATGLALASDSTSSTTYTDLSGGPGPSVTVTTGTAALVIVHAQSANTGAGSARMAYDVSGATSIAAADNRATGILGAAGAAPNASAVALHIGGSLALTPGVNTFTAKYRVSSGTGTFEHRRIIVFPL